MLENNSLNAILGYFVSPAFRVTVIAIIVIAVLLFLVGKATKVAAAKLKEKAGSIETAGMTFIHVASSVVKGILLAVAVIFILQANGVQVSALITSVSIITAIIGLAFQDVFKDLIQGIHIVSDKYFMVGDCVRYKGVPYEVIDFTMRSTKGRSLLDGAIITISNRNISEIEKMGNVQLIELTLSYEEDFEFLNRLLLDTAKKVSGNEDVESCVYCGVQRFEDCGITFLFKLYCRPNYFAQVKRDALGTIYEEITKAGVSIPYPKLSITSMPENR